MAGGAPNMDQFELYFKRADLDQDGRISGAEAVSFFQASGLPTQVLAQIWTHADQNRTGYLGRAEFYNALKLVTVAQSKRDLTSDIVKAALHGPASAKIPAPQINLGALPVPQSNLNVRPPVLQMRGNAPAPVASHSMGIRGPQGYSSQQSQDLRPRVTPLPNSTSQPQHGGSSLFNDWLNERNSSPSPGVSSQVHDSGISISPSLGSIGLVSSEMTPTVQPRPQRPTGLSENIASKPNGATFAANGTKATNSSSPVAGNGFVSSSGFGDNSFAASPGLNVSSSNNSASTGTHFPNKINQSPQSNVARQPTAGQNQQIHVNSSTFPVRAENVPSIQSSHPWPKMTQSNVQKYTKVFVEVDTDRDGKITGEQARTLFLSWRVPREILKQVWDLSDQDNDSMLSLKEFCIALHLMERYREGHPLPGVLPPGIMFEGTPLPPSGQPPAAYGAPVWRPAPGVQQGHRMTAQRQVTHAAARPPRPVPVPIAAADEDLQPRHQKPRVPVLEKHLVDQLSTDEQSSLNSKFQEATEADKKVGELEKEILEAKQKTEFYRNKMQEIVLYKSRCDTRLNEITERVSADKREVESLSKKYEDKYKQAGDVASKLTIEEATFRDIQEKKIELYRAIVKLEQDGKPDDIQVQVERIQADIEEQIKALNERCKMYGLHAKPTLLVELPFGWQAGIQEGAADWDENWDNFEDEGFTFVKELTLDVQNVVAPPKQKSLPVQNNKHAFKDESLTEVASSHIINKSEKVPAAEDITSDNESVEQHKINSVKTPPDSPASIKAIDSPSKTKIFQDFPAENIQSEHVFSDERTFDEPGKATFDSHDDLDAAWDFTATNHKDMDEESLHGNTLFDSSDRWGLNPIRTEIPKKSTFTFDSVPGTPAYSYSGSPPGNLFHNQGPFADSVPSTPAYSNVGGDLQGPFTSAFADSFNSFSRFDSFSSPTQGDDSLFSRFDSFRSTAQDAELDQGLFPRNIARFDSMHSTNDYSFDDSDPFGSNDQFKSETPRRDSVDGWKAF